MVNKFNDKQENNQDEHENLDSENDIVIEDEDNEGEDNSFESNPKNIIAKLKEKLKETEYLKNKYLDDLHRVKADFVNARRQDEESNKNIVKFGKESLISDIIPVLDSFDMAFSNKEAWSKISKEWSMGIENIYSQFLSILEIYGVKQINPQGENFDPKFHESLESIPVENKEEDHKILEVIQKGYSLHDKIIRSAKVKIGEFK